MIFVWADHFQYSEGQLVSRISGNKVGWKNVDGYTRIKFKGKIYQAHRIIWEIMVGPIPAGSTIDHIDRDRSNNKMNNLRLASPQEQAANTKLFSSNKSGKRGVSWNKEMCKWQSQLTHSSKRIHIGFFDSLEDAGNAYNELAEKLKGDFYNATDTTETNLPDGPPE